MTPAASDLSRLVLHHRVIPGNLQTEGRLSSVRHLRQSISPDVDAGSRKGREPAATQAFVRARLGLLRPPEARRVQAAALGGERPRDVSDPDLGRAASAGSVGATASGRDPTARPRRRRVSALRRAAVTRADDRFHSGAAVGPAIASATSESRGSSRPGSAARLHLRRPAFRVAAERASAMPRSGSSAPGPPGDRLARSERSRGRRVSR